MAHSSENPEQNDQAPKAPAADAKEKIEAAARSKQLRERLKFDTAGLGESIEEIAKELKRVIDEVRSNIAEVFKGTPLEGFIGGLFSGKKSAESDATLLEAVDSLRESGGNYKAREQIETAELPNNTSLSLTMPSSARVTSDIQHGRFIPSLHKKPSNHHGVDIGIAEGTPLLSPGYGRVSFNKNKIMSQSAGWYMDVEYNVNGQRKVLRFLHMKEPSPLKEGQLVRPGDLLGLSGETPKDKVKGAHLHFEVRDGGTPSNPTGSPSNPGPTEDPFHYLPSFMQEQTLAKREEHTRKKGRDSYWSEDEDPFEHGHSHVA